MFLLVRALLLIESYITTFHVAAIITSKTYIPMKATIFSSLLLTISRVTAIISNLYSCKIQSPAKHRIIPPLLQLLFTANIPMSPTIFSQPSSELFHSIHGSFAVTAIHIYSHFAGHSLRSFIPLLSAIIIFGCHVCST